jgi:putative protein-disulfide isomerase
MSKTFTLILSLFFLIADTSAQSVKKKRTMNQESNKGGLCDTSKGLCEIPGVKSNPITEITSADKLLKIVYFTDPICSACWSIEPQLRKLLLEYGAYFKIEYHMGGLLPSWEVYNAGGISKPSDVAHHWEEMSAYSGMPIDGDVWLKDPLASSYPACMAYKSAELQGQQKAEKFLRRIKEMVMMEGKNIAKTEHLTKAAQDAGMDTDLFLSDLKNKAPQLFQADLELAAKYGVRGFPAIYIKDAEGNQAVIYGIKPYDQFEDAIKKLLPAASKKKTDYKAENTFQYFKSLTLKEYSVINDLSTDKALETLTTLEKKGLIRKQPGKNGSIWRAL